MEQKATWMPTGGRGQQGGTLSADSTRKENGSQLPPSSIGSYERWRSPTLHTVATLPQEHTSSTQRNTGEFVLDSLGLALTGALPSQLELHRIMHDLLSLPNLQLQDTENVRKSRQRPISGLGETLLCPPHTLLTLLASAHPVSGCHFSRRPFASAQQPRASTARSKDLSAQKPASAQRGSQALSWLPVGSVRRRSDLAPQLPAPAGATLRRRGAAGALSGAPSEGREASLRVNLRLPRPRPGAVTAAQGRSANKPAGRSKVQGWSSSPSATAGQQSRPVLSAALRQSGRRAQLARPPS